MTGIWPVNAQLSVCNARNKTGCTANSKCCWTGSQCNDLGGLTLSNNPSNCGSCGNRCPVGRTSACCAGKCTLLDSDPLNCNKCGTKCSKGFVCRGGSCVCPTGTCSTGKACNTVVGSFATDPRNCGACGKR